MKSFSQQGQTKNAILWSSSYKAKIISQESLLRFISSFHHVLVLIGAFQKYVVSRDFLLKSAFFAFLLKFKPYSSSQMAISFMK